jgi:NTP pyrophosphatase (non-canonical NTP hydrolase)
MHNQKEWNKALLKQNFIPIFDYWPYVEKIENLTQFLNKNKMSKINTILEYQGLAARTCPTLEGEGLDERHMNLGVITEIGEALDIFKKNLAYNKPMDLVNLGEELADMAWYIVNKCRIEELSLEDNFDEVIAETKELVETKMFTQENLPSELKAEAILTIILSVYCAPVNTLFSAPIIQLGMLYHIASWFGLDFFQCLTNNIEKLKVRYPEKFTNEAAQNRDLEAERKELEKE